MVLKTKTAGFLAVALVLSGLAGCVSQPEDQSVRILRSDGNEVVLRGLIDATRSTPPERYDTLAATECAKTGKAATFASMSQRSTFGFDVTYRCGPKA